MASPALPVRDDEDEESLHGRRLLRRRNGHFSPVEQTFMSDIAVTLENKDEYRGLLKHRGPKAQETMDLLQSILYTTTSIFLWTQITVALQRLAWRTGLFPMVYALRGVEKPDQEAVTSGRFGDVYRGQYEGSPVCIKMLRLTQKDRKKVMKLFAREAILWGQLSHRNIFPFYGVCTLEKRPCMISPWAENGNVTEYLTAHPNADRLALVKDMTDGLAYLHTHDIVHGDLKGSNVLVDSLGHACLSDFGLSSIYDHKVLNWTSQSAPESSGGTVRWQAPELLREDFKAVNTRASDIYAWGCTAYEIFTGELPYAEVSMYYTICLKKMQGEPPSQPSRRTAAWAEAGLDDDVWVMLVECWQIIPEERPDIGTIQVRTGDWSSRSTSDAGSLYMDGTSVRSRTRGLPFFFNPRG